jgi:hypothetical protein
MPFEKFVRGCQRLGIQFEFPAAREHKPFGSTTPIAKFVGNTRRLNPHQLQGLQTLVEELNRGVKGIDRNAEAHYGDSGTTSASVGIDMPLRHLPALQSLVARIKEEHLEAD